MSSPIRSTKPIGFYWLPFVSMDSLCFNGLDFTTFLAMFLPLKCCFNCFSYLWHRSTAPIGFYWLPFVSMDSLCFNRQLSCNVFPIEMLFQLSLIFMTSGIKISETQCICCTYCPQNILKNCPTPISWSIKNDGGPRKSSRYFDFRHLSTPANAQPYFKAFLSCEKQILLCGWRKYVWLFLRNPR